MRETRDAFPRTFHNPCDCSVEECFQRKTGEDIDSRIASYFSAP
jgi:hypothetical protein